MKPVWAALGIILLLTSLFFVIFANLGYQRTDLSWDVAASSGAAPNKWTAPNTWNLSADLNQGDYFKVEIYAAQDWTLHLEPIGTYAVPFKASFVNITSPSGNQTELECDFLMLSSNPNNALVFYNLTGTGSNNKVEAHGIGSVRFEIPYGNNRPGIVAQALSSGTYWANMTWLEGGGSAPFNITISRGVSVTTTESYTVYYPVGFGIFAVSAVSLVYGFKSPKKTIPKRKVKPR